MLDYQPEEVQNNVITVKDETITAKQSLLQHYQDRLTDQVNQALIGVTLFNQLQVQNQITQTIWPQTPLQVINYFLQYLSDLESREYDDYYHIKLMLYYLFKCFIDLLSLNRQDYRSYIDAFQAYRRLYVYLDDFYTDLVANSQDIDSKDSELVYNKSNNKPLVDFEVFAHQQPYNDDLMYSFTDNLSSCDLDRIYDQTLYVSYDLITPKDQDQFKLLNYTEQVITVDLDPSLLNLEQQKLYDIVIAQYIQELIYNDLL